MKRVLHIQKVTGMAGSERHLLFLLPELARDFDITFLILEAPRRPVDDYVAALTGAGVKIERLPIRWDGDPLCVLQMARLMRKGAFDLVHTHLIHADVLGGVAARLAGVPVVVSTKHGYEDYDRTSRAYRLSGLTARWTRKVIAISEALARKVAEVERIPTGKLTTIHYGIDCVVPGPEPLREAVRRSLGLPPDAFAVLSTGRLVPVKGYQYLVEAIGKLRAGGSSAILLIAGDGPERAVLQSQAERLGVGDGVRFLGWRADVPTLLTAVDAFALATLGEGFGLAILEAMAQRLPVVATRVIAVPEIVQDGETGLLVPPRDPAALADALLSLERDPELRRRFGAAGHRRVLDHFSVARMVRDTEGVYADVLSAGGRGVMSVSSTDGRAR
jgi:glycosyltransferase involved in cell wall biosynthesis